MKRMLFNATQQEELRVAIVDGQKLIDIDIETTGREQRKSNIYKGVITRIEPSLEACFVNYGEERHGFLPFKEVARSYFREGVDVRSASIKDALREGQEIMVQVEKEERGNKGAALTSFVSLAGRYLVLMPNNPRGGGVSRRVEGEDRQELRETMDKLDLPNGMSVIARTAGIGRNVDELQWDLNYLMQLWRAIEGAGQSASGAFLIYQESSLVIRAIRDYFQPDIGEILIDTDDIYEQAQQFMSHVMPDMVHRVKRYRDDVPLFSRFQIEHQIETAYSRTVPLPSGGAIVIDHTEALVSVDVNSARSTRGGDIETTAFNTNCEAAEEVARQLRLRDLGGLIVIDFIDMENAKNQREVETRLKDALHFDRARVQMGKISRFGLMELSRQRLRPSLSEGSHVTCPRCNGTGHIRDTESSALQVLRIIQEEAMKENSAAIHVQAPVDVSAFLLNEKRGEILKIETRHRVTVILIPNKHLETPHYKLERIKHDDPRLEESQASYNMVEEAETDISYGKRQKEEVKARQEAVVKGITPDQPAPIVERKVAEPVVVAPPVAPAQPGFFSRLISFFTGTGAAPVAAPAPVVEEKPQTSPRERGERKERGQRNRGARGGRERNEERGEERKERSANRNAPRDETAKAPATESTPNARPPKPPREPREAREPREPREQREPRENAEGRQRAERPPRPPREERKEAVAEAKAEETLLQVAATEADAEAIDSTATAAEAGTDREGGEQGKERRRRRRGGRNRNRREREAGDNAEAGSEGGNEDAEGEIEASATVAQEAAPLVKQPELAFDTPQASEAPAPAAVAAPESEPAPTAAPTALSNAIAAPLVPQEVAYRPDATVAPIAAEPAQVAPPVVAPEPAIIIAPAAEPVAVVEPVAVAVAEPFAVAVAEPFAVVAVEPIPASTAAVEIPVAAAAPVVVAPAVAEPAPQIVVTAAAPKAAAPAADLTQVLTAAGLTLAATDPAKLRAAQEAAAQATPAPRAPRERKAAAALPSEPLVQVQTRH
ncbi:MAG: Rne/Rng family ribonuclease [Burkholderiaceae bacterium]|nr:Rne/Rng family ribonuclease [Burkholderiaceae bacterium]